jgi:GNAT superfamily N-acetyltransferase
MFDNSNLPVPADNIRLPDAITIKHGPAQVLSRLFVAADNMAQALGVDLKFRTDFQPLMRLNEAETAKGTWYKMIDVFDPGLSVDLGPENSFWIAAEDKAGEIVATVCGRVFQWRNTTLADEIRLLYYGGREIGQQCFCTAPLAAEITGCVYYAGGVWVKPDYRGSGISSLLPHVARAYAAGRWPLDCAMNIINVKLIEKTHPSRYGYSEYSYSVRFPGSPLGDVEYVICRLKADEIYADFAKFAADWREYVKVKKAA